MDGTVRTTAQIGKAENVHTAFATSSSIHRPDSGELDMCLSKRHS